MIPTVGRIVHVNIEPLVSSPTCTAGIVTRANGLALDVTIFAYTGPRDEAARRIVIPNDPTRWHDPRECPRGV